MARIMGDISRNVPSDLSLFKRKDDMREFQVEGRPEESYSKLFQVIVFKKDEFRRPRLHFLSDLYVLGQGHCAKYELSVA